MTGSRRSGGRRRSAKGIDGSQLVTFRGGHLFFMRKERKWFLDSVDTALTYEIPVPAT